MRTFAFLLEGGVPRERAQKLLAPLELTGRGLDPADSAVKGRLVWWHENFVAGLDSTGFCAFSAAGVLADGVMELGELASRLLGESAGAAPAEELLARGASLCLLARELTGAVVTPLDKALVDPWDEYRALRGLDASGVVLPELAYSTSQPSRHQYANAGGDWFGQERQTLSCWIHFIGCIENQAGGAPLTYQLHQGLVQGLTKLLVRALLCRKMLGSCLYIDDRVKALDVGFRPRHPLPRRTKVLFGAPRTSSSPCGEPQA